MNYLQFWSDNKVIWLKIEIYFGYSVHDFFPQNSCLDYKFVVLNICGLKSLGRLYMLLGNFDNHLEKEKILHVIA